MSGGRPSNYDAERFCRVAHEMMQAGATDREVAEALDISERALYLYKHQHPEFLQALKLGQESADDRVELSLYKRATGYSFDSIKIMQSDGEVIVHPYVEHVPPDVGAAKLWLTNRRGEKWREKIETKQDPEQFRLEQEAKAKAADVTEVARRMAFIFAEAQRANKDKET